MFTTIPGEVENACEEKRIGSVAFLRIDARGESVGGSLLIENNKNPFAHFIHTFLTLVR